MLKYLQGKFIKAFSTVLFKFADYLILTLLLKKQKKTQKLFVANRDQKKTSLLK